MANSWRPDGLNAEEVAKGNLPLFVWGTQEYGQVIRGIEIGFDAMLEALRKKGIPTDLDSEKEWGDSHILFTFDELVFSCGKARRGILVLIPDNAQDSKKEGHQGE